MFDIHVIYICVRHIPLDPKYKFSLNSDKSKYIIYPLILAYGQYNKGTQLTGQKTLWVVHQN